MLHSLLEALTLDFGLSSTLDFRPWTIDYGLRTSTIDIGQSEPLVVGSE
jgi:hypothetical protein